MSLTVTLQLNIGTNDAGDWANRSAGDAGTATQASVSTPAPRQRSGARDELLVRLHGLRGAVEAMRSETYGETLAVTGTSGAALRFGTPALYHGMGFILPTYE